MACSLDSRRTQSGPAVSGWPRPGWPVGPDNAGMEFFCYHRDRPGSMPLRDALREEHWSYMDGFAAQFIARGPTFTEDSAAFVATGSVHIVDVPDPDAARAFA